MPKAIKFLERLYMNIEGLLSVIFWAFDIFFLLKMITGEYFLCYQWKLKERSMTSWWTFRSGLRNCQIGKSNSSIWKGSLEIMHLMYSSIQLVYIGSHWHLIHLNKIGKLSKVFIPWWVLSDLYLRNFGCLKNYWMKLFKQLHMSRIVLLIKVQTVLPPLKKSINLFHLLCIFKHLDSAAMFMFLILLYTR